MARMSRKLEKGTPTKFRMSLVPSYAIRGCLPFITIVLAFAWFWGLPTTARGNTWFETPKRDACIGNGLRQYSAIITGSNYFGDWVAACRSTLARIDGAGHRPFHCGWAVGRVWGKFKVPDASCRTELYFEPPRKGDCRADKVRQYSAIITGTNYNGDWVQACRRTRVRIGEAERSAYECRWNGGRVWGEFNVPDQSCATHWEAFVPESCLRLGIRQYVAALDHPYGDDLAECRRRPAEIKGQYFERPTRCEKDVLHAGGRARGEFDVTDVSCQPRFGAPQQMGCESNRMLYRAQLIDVPSMENQQALCMSGRWKIRVGDGDYAPVRCQANLGGGPILGYVLVSEQLCGSVASETRLQEHSFFVEDSNGCAKGYVAHAESLEMAKKHAQSAGFTPIDGYCTYEMKLVYSSGPDNYFPKVDAKSPSDAKRCADFTHCSGGQCSTSVNETDCPPKP